MENNETEVTITLNIQKLELDEISELLSMVGRGRDQRDEENKTLLLECLNKKRWENIPVKMTESEKRIKELQCD